jgi:hypothetical protein
MPYLNKSKHALCFAFARVPSNSLLKLYIWPESLQLHQLENAHSAADGREPARLRCPKPNLTRGTRPHFKKNNLRNKDVDDENRQKMNRQKMRQRLTAARAHQAPNIVNRL